MRSMDADNTKYVPTGNSVNFLVDEHDNEVVNLKYFFNMVKRSAKSPSEYSIYEVPQNVKNFNHAAYVPRIISLGFQTHDVYEFIINLKAIYCNKFIQRNNTSLNTLITHLKECKLRVYNCYERPATKEDDYLTIFISGGIFIIEYLTRSCFIEFRERDDSIPSVQLQNILINHDLLLLKNQIPYFVLESIFNHLNPLSSFLLRNGTSPNFNDLVMSFFQKYNKNGVVPDFSNVKHFNDLIRTFHEPKRQIYDPRYPDFEFTASATHLHSSGVVFKKVSARCLLDVDFKNNCLELPRFELNEDQESLYRNLMALELCHYPDNTFIIDYFVFMDTLINTADDISLLVEAGVLVNRIGDYRDAANTFNKFCAGITNYNVANSYLLPVYGKLNAYYKTPKHTWMTTFKRDYFGSPLRSASTITAISLVVLTFISTVCSVISVM